MIDWSRATVSAPPLRSLDPPDPVTTSPYSNAPLRPAECQVSYAYLLDRLGESIEGPRAVPWVTAVAPTRQRPSQPSGVKPFSVSEQTKSEKSQ